ncbi:hypothetical protein U9M48_041787 [Paspalum notatum var. saurae]|uniref:RNase H type-1 domain-containing protein n=1 Tax=Paspalum notatum var. saurae TaxID=547442 RepID=A0AAQ3UP97_PASNO
MDLEHIRTRLLLATSANQMVKMVLDLKEEDLRRTVGLLWSWWEARNKANVGENRKSTTDVVYRAARLANEACHLEKASENQPRKEPKRWSRPPVDQLKINCDGAFLASMKTGGWGFVIRDHDGHGVLAGAGRLEGVTDVLCAESHACLAALDAAMEHGISRVIVETDSASLVEGLKTNAFGQAPCGVILKEIKELCRLHFDSVEVMHAPRSCNRCAHKLAKLGISRDPDQSIVWSDPLPDSVSVFVLGDLRDQDGE